VKNEKMVQEKARVYFRWDAAPTLHTPRLHLRELTSADSTDLFAIYGDAVVMEYASDPAFPDLSYVDQMLASVARLFAQRVAIEWRLCLRGEDRVIGTCGLHSFDPVQPIAEVGCILARPYWGQGLMQEALTHVIDFGFESLDLQALKADVDAPNIRSHALFQRLGFIPDSAGGTNLARRR
jgi:[ribosomal protein S5]-alanine N-acetyltransferase